VSDQIYLWCSTDPVTSVEGSVPDTCKKCDTPIVISPSGLKLMEEQGAIPVCLKCARQIKDPDDEAQRARVDIMPNPHAVEELRKAGIDEGTLRMLRALGIV
jgi:hypothetical protein